MVDFTTLRPFDFDRNLFNFLVHVCLSIAITTGMEELIRRRISAEIVECNAVDAAETELETTFNEFWEEYNKCCGYLEAFAADGRRMKLGNIGPSCIHLDDIML